MTEYFTRGDPITFKLGNDWGFGKYLGRIQNLQGRWFVIVQGQEVSYMIPENNFRHNNVKKEIKYAEGGAH